MRSSQSLEFWEITKLVIRRASDRLVTGTMLGCAAIMVRIVPPGYGSIYPPCPFKWATGWDCAGCGALRALHAVTDGDLGLAWSLNPLFVLFLGAFIYIAVCDVAAMPRLRMPSLAYPAIPVV